MKTPPSPPRQMNTQTSLQKGIKSKKAAGVFTRSLSVLVPPRLRGGRAIANDSCAASGSRTQLSSVTGWHTNRYTNTASEETWSPSGLYLTTANFGSAGLAGRASSCRGAHGTPDECDRPCSGPQKQYRECMHLSRGLHGLSFPGSSLKTSRLQH